MTLKAARELKAYIHSKYSINCTVPLGFGPDGYFPRSIMGGGRPHDWQSRQEFRDWLAKRLRENRRNQRKHDAIMRRATMRRSRSPIEMMVDRACGLA